jgi:nitroreductase
MRAPLLIILVYQPVTGKIPHWEQELTVGAVGMNLLQTLHVAGYAGQWLTEWPAFDDGIHAALGLGEQDRIAGFFYIGSADTPAELREDRPRPDMDSVALSWQAWQAGEHKK